MNFQVGQQIFGGQIVVLSVTGTYILLSFTALSGPTGPFGIAVDPSVTEATLMALLIAVLNAAPKPKAP